MSIQTDLEALVQHHNDAELFRVLTAVPSSVFGLAAGAARETWTQHFPALDRLDLTDGWYALGSEAYPDEPGVTFEVAFETADPQVHARAEPGSITQISFKIQFHVDGDATAVATEVRDRVRNRLAEHFSARVKRGRTLALPGGPLLIGAVRGWEHVYASFDFGWSVADGIETTLLMR